MGAPTLDGVPVQHVYESMVRALPGITVFVFGPDLRYWLIEGTGFAELGWSQEEIVGRRPIDVMAAEPDGARKLEDAMEAALSGRTVTVEIRGLRRSEVYWHNTISPLRSPDGTIVGGIIVSRNLGALKRAEQDLSRSTREAAHWSRTAERERRLRERLEFLTGVESLLSQCRDRREIMRKVTAAAVPRLGDWCSIHVLMHPNDPEPEVEVSHVDPERAREALEILAMFPYEPDAPFGIPHVIRTGEPVLITGIDPDALEQAGTDPSGLQPIRRLGLTSSLMVPLGAPPRVTGVLTFSVSGHDRTLDTDDLTLAQALSGRVAATMENRRLSEVEHHIARTLQRSLLPAVLPDVPGVQVAVRYWAAGEGTEVGGDFYDLFDTGHGAHAVVIGDVCGNGPAAAAVTASARHTIRALARRGDSHGAVLLHLNDAILTGWPDVFCTVSYATLEPAEGGVRMTAVSGGHPLPVLVSAHGRTTVLGQPGSLIGAMPIPEPEPYQADLAPGETVVFYTDGAYDLPPPHDLSDDDLLRLFSEAAGEGGDAEAMADAISARLQADTPFDEREDDIALVVLRVLEDPAQA